MEKEKRESNKLLKHEMETVLINNAASKEWQLSSSDPKIVRKLERQGWVAISEIKDWHEKTFRLPFSRIGIRRPVTDKERERGKQALKNNTANER